MIQVTELADGIKVTCPAEYKFAHNNTATEVTLKTKDESTGEYSCTKKNNDNSEESIKIFVMFRSKFCINNCVVKCDEKTSVFKFYVV